MEEKSERKIVVVMDENEESMYSLSWCLSNLVSQTATNCTLTLLFIKQSLPLYPSVYTAEYLFSNDVRKALDKHSNDTVNAVMKKAKAMYRAYNNVTLEKMVGIGDPKDVICGCIDKIKADTLVMGSHESGFFKRALLGSVVDHCAKHVKCPVMIVKRT